jgi:hypothetical protein
MLRRQAVLPEVGRFDHVVIHRDDLRELVHRRSLARI